MVASPPNISAHSFSFTSLDGDPMPLLQMAGKAVLVVNTASECGFTPQYKALQDLFERYRARGLIVIGVPSNDFGKQEPGTADEIKAFCGDKFGVEFPLTEKTIVKGDQAHPFYKWAAAELGFIAKPRWNFHKYLIAPNGALVNWFTTPTSPESNRMIKAIERVLPDGL